MPEAGGTGGATVCPKAGVAAASVAHNRKSRRRIFITFMMSPLVLRHISSIASANLRGLEHPPKSSRWRSAHKGASSNIAPCRGDPRGRPYIIRTQRGQGSNLAQPRLAHPVDAMLAVLGLLVDEGTSQTPCWQGVWQGAFPGRASRLRPGAETRSAQGSAHE